MALTTPTTQEISDNIVAQLEASLNQTIPLLPKAFNRVLAKVLSAVFILIYKYAGFSFLQMFVSQATADETEINGKMIRPLIEWGRLIGVGDPTPATNAELTIEIVVENQTGTLQSNSQLLNTTSGIVYITLGAVNLDAPIKNVVIKASSDQSGGNGAGAIGNMSAGEVLSFVNPLANVAREVTVINQVTTGANAEDIEVYRQRVVDRFQKRPQGGAPADYELWGESVAGIVNVYPYKSSDCPGQIDLYVEATEASSGSPDGIPTVAQLQAVLDAVNLDDNGLASRRPINALVNTFPISRTTFNVEIFGLLVDNAAQIQADILSSLEDYFREREPFIQGLSIPPRTDRITTTGVSGIIEDIVSAAGGIFNSATVTIGVTPILGTYSLLEGEKAKLGTVTYTS